MNGLPRLNIGELSGALKRFNPKLEVTFGSTNFSMKPLVFHRLKSRGEGLVEIETNELDPDVFEPLAECDARPTIADLLEQLALFDENDEITFGASMDAIPFTLRDISVVVGINLFQRPLEDDESVQR